MAERTTRTEEINNDGIDQKTTRTVTTSSDDQDRTVVAEPATESQAQRIVWFVAGVLLTLLAFRFILSLLGANRDNGFADFIYGLSYPFVAPFFGLFNYKATYGVSRFEIETLVAMLFYAIVAAGIVQLIKIARKEA